MLPYQTNRVILGAVQVALHLHFPLRQPAKLPESVVMQGTAMGNCIPPCTCRRRGTESQAPWALRFTRRAFSWEHIVQLTDFRKKCAWSCLPSLKFKFTINSYPSSVSNLRNQGFNSNETAERVKLGPWESRISSTSLFTV